MAVKKKDTLIEEFNRNPDEKHWNAFKSKMRKDKAKYYYVIYPKDVKTSMNLRTAYAVIFNGRYRQLYKIPIIKNAKKGIEGATIYLKGLEVNRRVI